ncbi:acetate--CoA ligase family protein [Thermodesulfobacteriota bacterium]
MNIDLLIDNAKKVGNNTLDEADSKQVIKEYGIPVINDEIASNPEEAMKMAETIGFPVVLKGIGPTLTHKTERGLVQLNLSDANAVQIAAETIMKNAGSELRCLLVEPQIAARREFAAGLFYDDLFGPAVMFGIGGVFTEAFSDVAFRLAPLTESDAREMIDEINAKALLGKFRGEMPVDRDQLVQALIGLSRIAGDYPDISEIDINPLVVTPKGKLLAVDALVVVEKNRFVSRKKDFHPPVEPAILGSLFYPDSIAFVGASGDLGKWGHRLLINTISGGYEGDIYPVNKKGGSIAGKKVYKSLSEISGSVDLAVVSIPAAYVLDLVPQLEAKGVKNMLLISSGFSETGAEGKKLEKKLVKKAREAGILVVGPNTMGICNPHIHLYCTGSAFRSAAGSTAIVSQSGNMGVQLLSFAEQQGIHIRAFCGSGNEAMTTIEDYLDAFEVDSLTKTVMLYVESVKNGRRFFEIAKRVGKKKPIILLKGGRTSAGNRAAASHTGAMSSDARIFNTVCRQTGIVKVEQPTDMLDLTAAFSSLPLPKGNRAAIMTIGGGWGVITTDLCSEYGLEVPELSSDILKSINKLLPPYWSRTNPVDLVGERDTSLPLTVTEELLKWDGCDAVINLGIIGRRIMANRLLNSVMGNDPAYSNDFLDSARKQYVEFEKTYIERIAELMEKYDKPVFGVSIVTDENSRTVNRVENRPFRGVFFQTPEKAVKAFTKMYEYYRFLKGWKK